VFEHFTDRGRRVVVLAQEESRLLGHDFIGSEHLLLALLHDEDEVDETRTALQQAGVALEPARQYVEQLRGRGRKPLSGHIPFSPRAKKVLELSMRVSQRLDGHVIGEPHLLRAMLNVPDSTAYRVMAGFGVDPEALSRVADELALACQAENEGGGSGVGEVSGSATASRGSGRPFGRARYRAYGQSSERLIARAEELTANRDALSVAVRRYGRHDDTCQPDRGCTCGLQQVLDDIDRP
jgi:ATP-dependent Clp protease ATP-binding subunit ClpC